MPEFIPTLASNGVLSKTAIGGGEVALASTASFGEQTNEVTTPDSDGLGVGGDSDTIWWGNNFDGGNSPQIYQLSTSDGSTIQVRDGETAGPGAAMAGAGGNANIVWTYENDDFTDDTQERSPTDLSIVQEAGSPIRNDPSAGTGGDENAVWESGGDGSQFFVWEIAPSDLSTVRQSSALGYNATGIGGTENHIWQVDKGNNLRELSLTDFSTIQQTDSAYTGGNQSIGCGGDDSTMWQCDEDTRIAEVGTGL